MPVSLTVLGPHYENHRSKSLMQISFLFFFNPKKVKVKLQDSGHICDQHTDVRNAVNPRPLDSGEMCSLQRLVASGWGLGIAGMRMEKKDV